MEEPQQHQSKRRRTSPAGQQQELPAAVYAGAANKGHLLARTPLPGEAVASRLRHPRGWPGTGGWLVPGWEYTAADHARFEAQGFYTSPGFLCPAALQYLRQEVVDTCARLCRHVHPEWVLSLHQLLPASNNWAWELATQPALLRMVCASLGTEDIVLFSSQLAVKPPHGGEVVPWHQDGERCRTVWICLDDVSEETGALVVKPGWHKRSRLPFKRVESEADVALAEFYREHHLFQVNPGITPEAFLADTVSYTLPAGSIEMHHPLLPHFSPPNRSSNWRRAIILRFQPASEPVVGGTIHDFVTCRPRQKVNYLVSGHHPLLPRAGTATA